MVSEKALLKWNVRDKVYSHPDMQTDISEIHALNRGLWLSKADFKDVLWGPYGSPYSRCSNTHITYRHRTTYVGSVHQQDRQSCFPDISPLQTLPLPPWLQLHHTSLLTTPSHYTDIHGCPLYNVKRWYYLLFDAFGEIWQFKQITSNIFSLFTTRNVDTKYDPNLSSNLETVLICTTFMTYTQRISPLFSILSSFTYSTHAYYNRWFSQE
jgi:hypothetical protein